MKMRRNFPLAFAKKGSIVRVIKFRGRKAFTDKLEKTGIFKGVTLKIIDVIPADKIVLEINNLKCPLSCPLYKLCPFNHSHTIRLGISFGEAMLILVEEDNRSNTYISSGYAT